MLHVQVCKRLGLYLVRRRIRLPISESNSAESWNIRYSETSMTIDRTVVNVCPGIVRTTSSLGSETMLLVAAYVVLSTQEEKKLAKNTPSVGFGFLV